MGQIKDGKHLYRALEAHVTLYLALYTYYQKKFFDEHHEIEKEIKDVLIVATEADYNSSKNEKVQENHNQIKDKMKSIGLVTLHIQFDEKLTNQPKFFRNYMKLVELLLLFIKASRKQDWILHLQSLNSLCPYFFAFDMTNYARMTPVYLTQMYELEENDPLTWEMMMNGSFSVNKSGKLMIYRK